MNEENYIMPTRNGWGMVPHEFWSCEDANVIRLVGWMQSHDDRFKWSRQYALNALGWSDSKFTRVVKSAKDLGYLTIDKVRAKGGRWVYIYRPSFTASQKRPTDRCSNLTSGPLLKSDYPKEEQPLEKQFRNQSTPDDEDRRSYSPELAARPSGASSIPLDSWLMDRFQEHGYTPKIAVMASLARNLLSLGSREDVEVYVSTALVNMDGESIHKLTRAIQKPENYQRWQRSKKGNGTKQRQNKGLSTQYFEPGKKIDFKIELPDGRLVDDDGTY